MPRFLSEANVGSDDASTFTHPGPEGPRATAPNEHDIIEHDGSSYRLAGEATEAHEGARRAVAGFVNAPHHDEVVFTKNASGRRPTRTCASRVCEPARWRCQRMPVCRALGR